MSRSALPLLSSLLLAFGAAAACATPTAPSAVHVVVTKGAIGPITERFLDRALARAEGSQAQLVVIELDTPGGLDSSMRQIVQRIEAASVPVAVYVWPAGARAASAGTFITMAGHVAAMAPNTSIGAASPVALGGAEIDATLRAKIENDAVAFIRGIAELRGRNADWAEQAVREAAAASQSQALDLGVVDLVANDLDDLLRQTEGRTLVLRPGVSVTLGGHAAAPRVVTAMTPWERFLAVLADPTLASLLISLGFLGLLIELGNPGLILPGVGGAIALALGFLGLGVLPVDAAGLTLIALGLLLLGLELYLPGGILGVGGVVALVLGAVIAFRETPAELRPPLWLVMTSAAVVAAVFAGLSLAVARIRGIAVAVSGAEGLVGRTAVARTPLAPNGLVFVHGERWRAELEGDTRAEEGDRVRIVGVDGLRLRVRREH